MTTRSAAGGSSPATAPAADSGATAALPVRKGAGLGDFGKIAYTRTVRLTRPPSSPAGRLAEP